MSRSSRGPQPSSLIEACIDTLAGMGLLYVCIALVKLRLLTLSVIQLNSDLRQLWPMSRQQRPYSGPSSDETCRPQATLSAWTI